MPDDLYCTDIVTWSRLQAERLRRHVAGERVNDLDWEHVIEEIEDLGSSEIASVSSLLLQSLTHLLKAERWSSSPSVRHWRAEAITFLDQARERYRPSMAKDLDLARLFTRARKAVLAMDYEGPVDEIPGETTLTLAELMDPAADLRTLVDRLAGRA